MVIPSASPAVNTHRVVAVWQECEAPIRASRDQLNWRRNGSRSCPSKAASAVVGLELLLPMMTVSAKGGAVCPRGGGGGGGGGGEGRRGGTEEAGWKEASLQHTVWTATA